MTDNTARKKPITEDLPYGESTLAVTFGKALKNQPVDSHFELNLVFNCTQVISQGVVKANPDVIAVAGRIEKTPDNELLGVMVFYRPRPEEWKKPEELQKTVDRIFYKWTAPPAPGPA